MLLAGFDGNISCFDFVYISFHVLFRNNATISFKFFIVSQFRLLPHRYCLACSFLQFFFGYGFRWSLFPGDEDVAMFKGGHME